jgi:anti-sigma factor RsiW
VSGHERERLSAYLDGELAAAERAEVSAHLAACPECEAFLADLAAVDAEAAGLPAAAPDGYFDRFPSRVVARLAAGPRTQARRGRLPVWTWAAAAALLLAVVTPLTLRARRAGMAPAPAPEALTEAPGTPELDAKGGRGAAAAALAPKAAPASQPASAPFAVAPPSTHENRADRAERRAVTERQEHKDEPLPVPAETAVPPPAGVIAAAAPQASAVREEAFVDESAAAEAAGGPPPPARTMAVPAAASLESAAPAPGMARAATGKAAVVDEAGRAFRRLDTVRPAAAEEWRRLREGWLAFAAAHPGDRRADEARVRAIEASREAWLAGGEETDERTFRRDASAYLSAPDSLQKPRVERLLAEPRQAP